MEIRFSRAWLGQRRLVTPITSRCSACDRRKKCSSGGEGRRFSSHRSGHHQTSFAHAPFPSTARTPQCSISVHHQVGHAVTVRASRLGEFDGDCLCLAASVPGGAPAVRAAPDGGCCVVYLRRARPVYLGHAPVNDAAYLDAAMLHVAAREQPGRRNDGGVTAFSALTRGLRHHFRVAHGRQPRSFTATALAFAEGGGRVFASCKGRFNLGLEHGCPR